MQLESPTQYTISLYVSITPFPLARGVIYNSGDNRTRTWTAGCAMCYFKIAKLFKSRILMPSHDLALQFYEPVGAFQGPKSNNIGAFQVGIFYIFQKNNLNSLKCLKLSRLEQLSILNHHHWIILGPQNAQVVVVLWT